jgi:hypothetical protein
VQSTLVIQTNGVNPACPASAGSQSTLTLQLTGTGSQLSLLVRPTVIDFGDTLIGTIVTKTVTLENESSAPVSGLVAVVAGGDPGLFTLSGVPSSLEGYQSVQVTITYAPTTLETRSLADVSFQGSDGERAKLNLFGEPIGCALTVEPNPINFGYIPNGESVIGCMTVSNQCTISITLSSVDFSVPDGPWSVSQTDGVNPTPIPVTIPDGGSAKVCFSYAGSDGPPPSETATLVLEGWDGGWNGSNPVVTL